MFPWSQSQPPATTCLPPYTAAGDLPGHLTLQGATGGYVIRGPQQHDAVVTAYNPPQDPTQDTDPNGNEINSNTCPNNRNIVRTVARDPSLPESRENTGGPAGPSGET